MVRKSSLIRPKILENSTNKPLFLEISSQNATKCLKTTQFRQLLAQLVSQRTAALNLSP